MKNFDIKEIAGQVGLQCIGAMVQTGLNEIMIAKRDADKKKWCSLHIYDKKHDITYELKRPMTNDEKVSYSERVTDGENIGTVLKDMKVLA